MKPAYLILVLTVAAHCNGSRSLFANTATKVKNLPSDHDVHSGMSYWMLNWSPKLKELASSLMHWVKRRTSNVSKKINTLYQTSTITIRGNLNNSSKPWFCHDLECPKYVVINKTERYETRCYPAALWVATAGTGYGKDAGDIYNGIINTMFKRLSGYLQGENDKKMKIKMTTPIILRVRQRSTKRRFHMHVYIPEELQKHPPKPSDPTLFFVKKHMCSYVRSFKGFVRYYSTYKKEMEILKSDLIKDGLEDTFQTKFFDYTWYDSPFRNTERHNEVWFYLKKKKEEIKE